MKKIIIVLLTMLLLVGCADKEIIGKWYEEATGQFITFNNDGTCEFSNQKYDYEAEDGVLKMFVDGEEEVFNYDIHDDHMDMWLPDMEDYKIHFDRLED